MENIVEAAGALTTALADFEPGGLSRSEAVDLVETLARVEKVCAAARARAAARAQDCGDWGGTGRRTGVEWLAKAMGTSRAQAAASIDTAKAIEGLPATKEAFATGRLSEAQAAEVARAAAVDRSAEVELLLTAEREDLRSLRDQARRVRLNAEDREALYERQYQARELHHWVDDEGMVAGRFRLPIFAALVPCRWRWSPASSQTPSSRPWCRCLRDPQDQALRTSHPGRGPNRPGTGPGPRPRRGDLRRGRMQTASRPRVGS